MNQIKPDTLLKIEELFLSKGWDTSNGNGISLSLFDKFCSRLRNLSDEQQILVIELTYNYTWIELSSYLENFYDSLISLGDSIYNTYNNIFVYPLLSISKTTSIKTKSAGFLHYMFETDNYTWLSNKFIPSSSIKYLQNNFNNKDSILILVDDFVGSGETAIEVCKEYLNLEFSNGKINPANIKVVTIAAQKQGIKNVKDTLDIEVVSDLRYGKGISDFYLNNEQTKKKELMENIEQILQINHDYRFGYKKSEALITLLHKTPNNTFPVYWHETRNKVAPFPRKKRYKIDG